VRIFCSIIIFFKRFVFLWVPTLNTASWTSHRKGEMLQVPSPRSVSAQSQSQMFFRLHCLYLLEKKREKEGGLSVSLQSPPHTHAGAISLSRVSRCRSMERLSVCFMGRI
jgi:hypothetical protein